MTRGSLLLVGLSALLWACGPGPEASAEQGRATAGAEAAGEPTRSIDEHLQLGLSYVQQGDCRSAITEGFQPAILAFEREHPAGSRVLGSRAGGGAALMTALTTAGEGQQDTVIMGPDYSDTLYLRAFCEIELGDPQRAEATLQAALAVIPDDIVYSCELGHLLQERNNHTKAIEVYRAALLNADMLERSEAFEPTAQNPGGVPVFNGKTIDDWRRRALRGIGFSQFELGDLDAAERAYRQVLAIDPNDPQAQRELQLIQQRRQSSV